MPTTDRKATRRPRKAEAASVILETSDGVRYHPDREAPKVEPCEIVPVRTAGGTVVVRVPLDSPSPGRDAATTAVMLPEVAPPATVPAERNPAAVYLAGLAPGSRRQQRWALETVARIATGGRLGALDAPWARMTYAEVAAIRAQLAARYAPATANRCLYALRRVLLEAWRIGTMRRETMDRARDVSKVHGERALAGRQLTPGELAALYASCTADPLPMRGARDAAILALCYAAGGGRREEAAHVVMSDVERLDDGGMKVVIRKGKGNKPRTTYLDNGHRDALAWWLDLRGDAPGPVLCEIGKDGSLRVHRITGAAIYAALRRRAEVAGVEPFSPHDLRRSFATDALDAGVDVLTVSRLLGHASPTTTARYDRRGEVPKRKAAAALAVPFRRPCYTTDAAPTASKRGRRLR